MTLAYILGRQSHGDKATEDTGQGEGLTAVNTEFSSAARPPGTGPHHLDAAPPSPSGVESQGSRGAGPLTQRHASVPRDRQHS